ncbi:MAG: FtsQ-type POTRA domain-containing protein [Deltaproteobacteria bacterium]|nr:FtsQ-type POTRA domain-containing protein [Deltaproteobacteria bacterium]
MKRRSVLDHQSVKRARRKHLLVSKGALGQFGFGLVKIFLFLLALGGLSLSFVSGYQFLSSSPYFRLDNIVVAGVKDALGRELIKMSGVTKRDSLLSLNAATIKRNIEAHPWVRSVLLKKEFPHTLEIAAECEEPVAIVLLDKMYFLGTQGNIFKEVGQDDSLDFPVITGLCAGDDKNGEYLKRVASFFGLLDREGTPLSAEEFSEVHVKGDGTLTIYMSGLPFKVFFGTDDFIRKVDLLRHVIKHLRTAHRLYQVRCIDLDYADRAIVAFVGRVV